MLEHPFQGFEEISRAQCVAVLIPCCPSLQLECQRALNEAVCEQLRARIIALWERLKIPQEERESSAMHLAGSTVKTRRAVRALLCSCWEGWGQQLWGSHAPGCSVRGEGSQAKFCLHGGRSWSLVLSAASF